MTWIRYMYLEIAAMIWRCSNRYATHTVAMKEHDSVLDPYTEYVTDSVMNDGIEKAMKHYQLI